ncbi:MAG: TlpA disulfide reductase family protein, partial [Acidimicrobiia bacterium]|nr:TlpA disulfide reductase family protein [Acidimicrobiia bacterium]MDX2466727.1 TlpA disulfide reductase family protein [Acidimicrobiia bacterium]
TRDDEATALVPKELKQFSSMLSAYPMPKKAVSKLEKQDVTHQVQGLVEFSSKRAAPGFDLVDFQGGRMNQDVYKGKVALVNFWATWCPPCVEEIPSLSRLAKRYNPEEFDLVSIDFRETPQELKKFSESVPVEFPVLMDEDGLVSMNWKVFSFPSTFLLDRQGRVRYSANRAIDWDNPEVWQVVDKLIEEGSVR